LELNPASDSDLSGFRGAGVTRLSVGVQSLDDRVLRRFGRPHTADQALRTISDATRVGFSCVSADLLLGIPGLKADAIRRAGRTLLDSGVCHVSAYSLEIHPNTPLHASVGDGSFSPAAPAEEESQWNALDEELEILGCRAYEVSNYCLPGHPCRHNLAYWAGGPYLGLGPGAHGYDPAAGPWGTRSWNDPGLSDYASRIEAARPPSGGQEALTADESLLEALFLALRRPEPILLEGLCAQRGFSAAPIRERAAQAVEAGLLRRESSLGPATVTPTRAGLRAADGLALWLHRAVSP
jgi:oxygen-independent coproporphyrinogen-3 oxidase